MKTKTEFTFDRTNVPLPIRWVNRLARISSPVSDQRFSLQQENIIEVAERRTGLRNWGNPRFKDSLASALDSVKQEGKLTFFGRFVLRQFLIENLGSRLRLIEVLTRFPEINQQKIQRPIFITGWYRSGTTHLHNLIARHPRVRAPLFWELRHPCPTLDPKTADPNRQIRRVKLASKIYDYLAPGFRTVHPLVAERPEECLHLFDKACTGTTPFFISEAKSIAWWLLEHDIQHGYDFFKTQLKLLNWLRPGRQWVLKWPYHLWHLASLLKAFPDAALIHLHRDPCQAVPSVCSLAALARSSFCETIDMAALGKFWLDYYEAGLARGFRAREKFNAKQFIDVRYLELKHKPLSVMNQVQKTFDLGEPEAWSKPLIANSKPLEKNEPSRHRYVPAQFGLRTDQIRERFVKYIEDYDLCDEAERQG